VRAAFVLRGEPIPPAKPHGGYHLISAVQLALAWWAYREGLIRPAELRVWFAAAELRARRCRRPPPLPCRFATDELRRLTGLSARRLSAARRRLEAAGLLHWSDAAVVFPDSPDAVRVSDREGFRHFLGQIPNQGRRVPVPRRILRLLAGGARPALIAAVLGHLFRCLYLKSGRCLARGRVKASWIAEAFGVGLRRVKEARQELVALGWLIPLDARQWALNRWGAHVRINLAWARRDGIAPGGAGLAPPPPASGAEPAPPVSDKEPLQGNKNQEPAAGGPAGFSTTRPAEKTAEPAPPPRDVAPMPRPAATAKAAPRSAVEPCHGGAHRPGGLPPRKPALRHLVPEDLVDTDRLLALHGQAVEAGLAAASEWGRLRFVAAAEHARVVGTRNPCGLFMRLVLGGLWHFATADDETAASLRLRRHLHGGPPERRAEPAAALPPGQERSADARLVREVRAALSRAGYRGDAFPHLRRQRPDFTRERWDRAVAELGW
jgi:hypothetical protein